MICPECGNEVDLFADKCLRCSKSFKSMSLAERQKLEVKPKRVKRTVRKSPKPAKANTTQTRVEYNNGIACKEGMSYTGRKMKKGSFKKRKNNEGTGPRIGSYALGGYYG